MFLKKIFILLILSVVLILGFAGCAFNKESKEDSPKEKTESIKTKSVKIGIVPSVSPSLLISQTQPLMDYLSDKLNVPVELILLDEYKELTKSLKDKKLDLVITGSLTAYDAIAETGAIPICRPEKNKVSTYRGVIFVRKDTGIKSLKDMKNHSFAYVDKETSAGYIYPRAEIVKLGEDPDKFFSFTVFAGKHDAVIDKVLSSEIEGGAVKNTVYYKIADMDFRINKETTVLMESKDFPDRTILARSDFNPIMIENIKNILLEMKLDGPGGAVLEKFGADRFIETKEEDFNYLKEEMNVLNNNKK
ncbi:MAG: phosphate/phosphite/phosphonate ABC transporter substrate-binding protein [Actinobacteria bacterium]|nr:phosphate/phosphite/phosphonate ABC transporter substrate-binding protein [Actinomycetota bacterium]